MFLRWLLKTFPTEMTRGWQLIRHDLLLWTIVAVGFTALATLGAGGTVDARVMIPVAAVTALLVVVLLSIRFEDAVTEKSTPISEILARAVRRGPLLIINLTLAVALSTAAGALLRAAVLLLVENQDIAVLLALAGGTIVYLSVLTRFCLVPFLSILDQRPGATASRLWGSLDWLLWPLRESARMTDGRRLRLAPYVALVTLGPAAVTPIPPPWNSLVLVAWQLTLLTAQAVLFLAYRRGKLGTPSSSAPPRRDDPLR